MGRRLAGRCADRMRRPPHRMEGGAVPPAATPGGPGPRQDGARAMRRILDLSTASAPAARPALSALAAAFVLATAVLPAPAAAQDTAADVSPPANAAVTAEDEALADILRRQEALDEGGRDPGALPATDVGPADEAMWDGIRHDTADVTTVVRTPAATTLIQTGGMEWQAFRDGPLRFWGAVALGATVALLALFYLIRGRIPIEGPPTGRRILRFTAVERFGHWVLGGSFVILAATGFLLLFGRVAIIPWLGHEAYAPIAAASKWAHNNVSWAFMLGLVIAFVAWVRHNLPSRTDLRWIARGGGFIGHGHPPAKKFNAGQKAIFWAVMIGGASLTASGLSLLFPFELPMFAKTFGLINDTGLPALFGTQLPTVLAPQEGDAARPVLAHHRVDRPQRGRDRAHLHRLDRHGGRLRRHGLRHRGGAVGARAPQPLGRGPRGQGQGRRPRHHHRPSGRVRRTRCAPRSWPSRPSP